VKSRESLNIIDVGASVAPTRFRWFALLGQECEGDIPAQLLPFGNRIYRRVVLTHKIVAPVTATTETGWHHPMSTTAPRLESSDGGFASLVPEFIVLEFKRSRAFWCEVLGFQVVFEREGFAYLRQGEVEVMIAASTGHWETAPLEWPFGRGLNFQMFIGSADAFAARITGHGWPLYREVHDVWYCSGGINRGYRQVLVQDPDGYLLRFAEKLGSHPVAPQTV